MSKTTFQQLEEELKEITSQGLYKEERLIAGAQGARITLQDGREVLNFCANNYLGLANHPKLIEAAHKGLEEFGFGVASVRFICGTQTIHRQLEEQLSDFLQTDDTILYPSCFDANGGLFETFLSSNDAVISDALNHASIIDGIRLCKAERFRYKNNDMKDLEEQLKKAQNARRRLIATDGVFSMDGTIANLQAICHLAEKYDALVMVDDCHATGFLGKNGRGSAEHCNVMGRIDILTGTLGKALGGASGGYTSGKKAIIDLLRQRSRPYLFSNAVAPSLVAASLQTMKLIEQGDSLREQLRANTALFREEMNKRGFSIVPGEHPIVPIMLGEAKIAQKMAQKMLDEGIYVIGFSYPVVPKGQARIRTQMSAAHSKADVQQAIDAFTKVAQEIKIL